MEGMQSLIYGVTHKTSIPKAGHDLVGRCAAHLNVGHGRHLLDDATAQPTMVVFYSRLTDTIPTIETTPSYSFLK